MPFQLRHAGRDPVTFETEPEAVAAARQLILDDPDAEPDIIDIATGKPGAPGATKEWREELTKRVGF